MPAKLDRCVADVSQDPSIDNPWAVCNASIEEQAPQVCQVCGADPISHLNDASHPFTNQSSGQSPFTPHQEQYTVSIPGSLSAINVHAKEPKIKETIFKTVLDSKLSCKCQKSKKQ